MTSSQDARHAPVGIFDGHDDVGHPKIAGSAAYDPIAREYTLTAGGVNMWGERDEFQFVWTRLTGDFVATAQVTFGSDGPEPHCKAGIIARPSLEDNAPYVDAALHRDGLTALQYRRTRGGISEHIVSALRGADTIRFERRGDRYTFTASTGSGVGAASDYAGTVLGHTIYVGLFLCSHNAAVNDTAVFANVRIVQ
jgi:hypothetical protein